MHMMKDSAYNGKTEITIRRMTFEDIPSAQQVEQVSFSEPWTQEMFHATLLLPYAAYYVAELLAETGKRIVGICGVRKILGEGEITNVAVLPGFRGLRIARRMLERLIRDAQEEEVSDFTLEVREGNAPAISLYKGLGFVTEGIRKNFYTKPAEDALIMWRRGIREIIEEPEAG